MKICASTPATSPRTKVWVVSLASAQARRSAFAKPAQSDSLDWDFFDAHDRLYPDLKYDKHRAQILNGRPMQNGELGCYSSHYFLWNWLEENDSYDQMVVIEDDVVMDWGFLSALCKIDFTSNGVEYLRLFSKMPSPWRFVATPFFDRYHHLIQFTGYPLGTQAYLLTRRGASKFRIAGNSVTAAVDVFMDRTWEHGVMNLAVVPFPAYERYQPSSIGEQRFTATRPQLSDRLLSFFPKVSRRVSSVWLMFGFDSKAMRQLRRKLVSLKPLN